MKKINRVTGWLICILIFSSCGKFLELTPRDQKVVKTIEDYRDVMASYMRLLKTPNRSQENVFGIGPFVFPCFDMSKNLGIYTGETNLNVNSIFYYDKNRSEYTKGGVNLLTWMMTESSAWNQYYEFLGPINLILNGLETAEGNNEELRNYVRGEALAWRAFAYFKLLQYYAPYKNNQYGIPVYLTPHEDVGNAMPGRKTQQEVFAQILGDCNTALALLEVTASNEWNCAWRYDFLNAMMAGIYTWKAMSGAAETTDWENAGKCATEAMRARVLTNDPQILQKMFDCRDVTATTDMQNDEFYFRIMDGNGNSYVCRFKEPYYENGVSDGKINLLYYEKFKEKDIRKEIYFNNEGTHNDKYNLIGASDGGCIILFRLAEMYLIKAEALARQGKTGEARMVLEEFKNSRYTEPVSVPTDATQLLQEILDERLREFYMENDFRWLDMKRLGVRVERVVGGDKYVLEPDDFRYCFPIPSREIELNKNMIQTPGWDKVILN